MELAVTFPPSPQVLPAASAEPADAFVGTKAYRSKQRPKWHLHKLFWCIMICAFAKSRGHKECLVSQLTLTHLPLPENGCPALATVEVAHYTSVARPHRHMESLLLSS